MPLPVIPNFAADGSVGVFWQDSTAPVDSDETPENLESQSGNEQAAAELPTETQLPQLDSVPDSDSSDQDVANDKDILPLNDPDNIAESVSQSESNDVRSATDQSEVATEEATTLVPADSPNLAADSAGIPGFNLLYLLLLIPVLLVAVAIAWYASKKKHPANVTDHTTARGRFKKTERLKQTPGSAPIAAIPRIDFDIDEEVLPGNADGTDSNMGTGTETDEFAPDHTSDPAVASELSDEDADMMFGEGKEAAFDQSQVFVGSGSAEPSTESTATMADETDIDSNPIPGKTVWRKKKFTPRSRQPIESDVSLDQTVSNDAIADHEQTDFDSKTVSIGITVPDPDSFDATDEFAEDQPVPVDGSEEQNAELMKLVAELREQLAAAGKRSASLIEQLAKAEDRASKSDAIVAENKKLSDEIAKYRSQQDVESATAQSEIDTLKTSVETLIQQKIDLESNSKKLEADLQRQTTDAQELADKLETQTDEATNLRQLLETETGKIAEIQTKLDDLDSIKTELETKNSELVSVQKQLQASDHRASELQSQIETAITDSAKVEKLDAANKSLTQERDEARERASDLTNQVAALQPLSDQIESIKNESLALTEQLTSAQANKDELQSRVRELELVAQGLEESQREIAELREQLKSADDSKDRMQQNLDELRQTAEQSKQLIKDVDQLRSQLDSVEHEKSELETKLNAEVARASTLEEQSSELEEKIKSSQELEQQVGDLKKELASLKTQAATDQNGSKSPGDSVNRKVKAKFTELYRAYERERHLRKELEVNLEQAEEQRDQIADQLRQLKNSHDSR